MTSRRDVLRSIVAGTATAAAGCLAGSSSTGEWPQFQFDAANTGYNPSGFGPWAHAEEAWVTGGIAATAAPVVHDGTVYAAAGRTLHALDAETGDLLWTFEADAPITDPPAGVGDVVVVGARTAHAPDDAGFHAVGTAAGEEVWRLGGRAASSPTVAGTTFVAGLAREDSGTVLVAADVADGAVRWETGVAGPMVRSPAVTDDRVVATHDDGRVRAYARADGSEQWHAAGVSAPAVAEGTAYVATPRGTTVALDAASGEQVWEFGAGRSVPTLTENGVCVTGRETLYHVDGETGEETWRSDVVPTEPPIVADDSLFFSAADGMYSLNHKDGAVRWHYEMSPATSPAIADNRLFVGREVPSLLALSD